MIKQLIACILFFVSAAFTFSQSKPDTLKQNKPDSLTQSKPDTLLITEPTGCEGVAYNSTKLIMYFYAIHDYDSAGIVLDYWEANCGISEPILRSRILFAILENHFDEALYDSTIVDYVLNYMKRMDITTTADLYHDYMEYFGFVPIREEYDYFTQCIADTLLKRIFYNPMELFFSEMYANVIVDPVKEIQLDTIYSNTEFRSFYDKRVDMWKQKADLNLNLFTGIWIPYGNAALLGNHPLLGMQVGVHKQKMTYNLTLAFRLFKSKNEYTILRDGNTETTDRFLGSYVGVDLERELIRFRENEFNLLSGIGYDGFQSILVNTEDDNPDNDTGHSIHSINTNFGLGYRHYRSNKSYIGLQCRYNFVNYVNTGGTNLSGDNLTVSIFFGGFSNNKKYYELNELRYVK